MHHRSVFSSVAFLVMVGYGVGCTGDAGAPGPQGLPGTPGTPGAPGAPGPALVDALELPGTKFFPEGITASEDGNLFVGSVATGAVIRFAPGSTTPSYFLPPSGPVKGATGLLVDESARSLLVCSADPTFQTFSPKLARFDLDDGTLLDTYSLPGTGVCSDMAFDDDHNLYITDTFGRIYLLRDGSAEATVWSDDPLLAPPPGGFGANGIAYNGKDAIYVDNFSARRLLRIRRNDDGSAGEVTEIAVEPPLAGPDGLRMVDETTLIVVENQAEGALLKVTLDGDRATSEVLSNRLDEPSAVVRVGNGYWITEGQVSHLTAPASDPPRLPFLVRRLEAF